MAAILTATAFVISGNLGIMNGSLMISINNSAVVVLVFMSLACIQVPAGATEPEMSPELRQSYRNLMDLLAPEPVVNKGSDGLLTALTQESQSMVDEGRG
ncbi:MAG: hypothetical protein AAF404_19035, partial [Pseudomonadota bacterium]